MHKKFVYLISVIKAISTFGSILTTFTIYVLLYNLSKTPLLVGAGGIIYAVSPMIFSGIMGAIVDKLGSKKSLFIGTVLNILVLIFILFLYDSWIALLILLFFYSSFITLTGISFNVLIPKLVEKENLFRFNSLLSLIFMIAGFPAPIFAGYFINVNIILIFLVDMATYILEIPMIAKLPSDTSHEISKDSIFKDLGKSIKYISERKDLLFLFSSIFIVFLFVGGLRAVLIPYFSQSFGESYSFFYGFYNSFDDIFSGITLLIFSLGVIKLKRHIVATSCGALLFFVSLFFLSFLLSLPIVIFSASLAGISSGIISPNSATYLQKNIEEKYLGRIFGVQHVIVSISTVISYLLLGTLCTLLNVGLVLKYLALGGILIFSIISAISFKIDRT